MSTIDAYAHVGEPRFGSAAEAIGMLRHHGVEKMVLVLGPGIPDLYALAEARTIAGDAVRVMGIPFGETEQQRIELAEAQLAVGIAGMRLMPFEVLPNRTVLDMLGRQGLWLYAINPQEDAAVTARLLEWLDCWPDGRIAAPHFLRPGAIAASSADSALMEQLLAHPRFHVIFSRHGGVGSELPYPHADLRPWVEDCIAHVGWERIMWGSEFPVMYWRNEELDECMHWVERLGIGCTERQLGSYQGANAQRLLFASPSPPLREFSVPPWVEEQFSRTHTVPLFPPDARPVPMREYAPLLSGFIAARARGAGMRFREFVDREGRLQRP